MKITVRGEEYHVRIDGDGPALLLLHGFTGSSETWQPFIKNWSQHFRVIAIDFLGHGLSAVPHDVRRYHIMETVQDIAELLTRLSIEQAHVLGYSMGGRAAIAFASQYPQMISSLILESTSPGLASATERDERKRQDNRLADEIERDGLLSFVNKWENIPLFATQKHLPMEVKQKLRSQRLSHSPQGLANSLRGMGTGKQPSYWDKLKYFNFPVLVLAGELDVKYRRLAADMVSLLPQASMQLISDAGHTIHLEKCHLFDKVVLDYLVKIKGGS